METLKDRYELHNKLGEGGMAEVYHARQISLDRDVAIKFIKKSLTDDAQFAQRFEREARAIARLNHPNIMHVYDFDRADEGRYFMVMELLRGDSLAHQIKDQLANGQFLALSEAITITRTVADALHYAHQNGVLHRDVKPQNIFITADNRVVVTDFGIAKVVSEGQLTETGTTIGTPHYFAPEQGYGRPIDHRVDVYALGVVFYELLTGQVPYDADSMLGIIAQHANAPIPDPREKRPTLPTETTAIVKKALAKNPDDRYADMGQLMADLDHLLEDAPTERGTVRLMIPRPAVSIPTFPAPADTDAPTTVDSKPKRGKRLPWVLGMVAALIVIVAGIVFALSQNGAESTPETATDSAVNLDIAPAADDEYLVLVADFVGDESLGVDIGNRIADILRTGAVASTVGTGFRLERVPVEVASAEAARELGESVGAYLVIYGENTAIGLELHGKATTYPEDTLTEVNYLLPAGGNFTVGLADDIPNAANLITTMLTSQRLLLEENYIVLLNSTINMLELIQNDWLGTPSTPLDQHVFDMFTSWNTESAVQADEAATIALNIVPNDPAITFTRWMVNGMILGRYERSYVDSDALKRLVPDNSVGWYADSTTAFFQGDYDRVLASTLELRENHPDSYYLVGFYRHLVQIELGDYQIAEAEMLTNVLPEGVGVDQYPATDPLMALIQEMKGDFDAIAEYVEVIRSSRLLETATNLFLSPELLPSKPDLVMFAGYYAEINGEPINAILGYELGLSETPDHALLNWRRGLMAQQSGDYQLAYDHLLTAHANAPAPLPIALYQAALLVQKHSAEIDTPRAACDLLADAETDIATDPEFFAMLGERVSQAQTEFGCEG